MQPKIEILDDKKLVGMSLSMSLAENKTFQLFSTFMPRRKEISSPLNKDIFDLRTYPQDYFMKYSPSKDIYEMGTY